MPVDEKDYFEVRRAMSCELSAEIRPLLVALLVAFAVGAGCRTRVVTAGEGAAADTSVAVPEVVVEEVAGETLSAVVEPDADVPAPWPEVPVVSEPEVVRLMLIPPGADTSPFLTPDNFFLDWHVLGPFTFAADDFQMAQQQDAIDYPFVADEGGLRPAMPAPPGSGWQEVRFDGARQAGKVDLDVLFGGLDYACAYAVASFHVPEEIVGASLRVGSDDYLKVWLNGKLLITSNRERRASDWDQDVVDDLHLPVGNHRLVVKSIDIRGDWDFYVRFTARNGMPCLVVPAPEPGG